MRAQHIMTQHVIKVSLETSILDAADIMLKNRVSGLPVVGAAGELVDLVSKGDILRRSELGMQRKRPRWLQFFTRPGRLAKDFVTESGRRIEDFMTRHAITAGEQTPLQELVLPILSSVSSLLRQFYENIAPARGQSGTSGQRKRVTLSKTLY